MQLAPDLDGAPAPHRQGRLQVNDYAVRTLVQAGCADPTAEGLARRGQTLSRARPRVWPTAPAQSREGLRR